MKFAFVAEQSANHRITELCRVMKVSCRGFYSWRDRPDSARSRENRQLLIEIKRVFYANREVYGAPRVHQVLLDNGFSCGLNRVARLMNVAKLLPKTIRKFRVTTDSRKSRYPAKNILQRQFLSTQANQKWVADVTYIPTREGWLFLAVIVDLFSRKVVGWSMSDRLTSELAQQALANAVNDRAPTKGLLMHSDQGKEYYASDYQTQLHQYGMVCSMSRKGNCYDNAVAESFFHSLKVEQVHHDDYKTRAQARSVLFDYIEIFYNRQRKHSYLNYQSPVEFEERYCA